MHADRVAGVALAGTALLLAQQDEQVAAAALASVGAAGDGLRLGAAVGGLVGLGAAIRIDGRGEAAGAGAAGNLATGSGLGAAIGAGCSGRMPLMTGSCLFFFSMSPRRVMPTSSVGSSIIV